LNIKFIHIVIVFFAFFQACEIINPAEEIPSYIHIDSFSLHGNTADVVTLNHNIKDAWVIVNNEFIGVFELPLTFPVLNSGVCEVVIRAGVIENGISNTRTPYPFYSVYRSIRNLRIKEVDSIHPNIEHLHENIEFSLKEGFESGKYTIEKSLNSNIGFSIVKDSSESFEGRSLKAVLYNMGHLFEIQSKEVFDLPRNKSVFMELNYKSDEVISIGYYASKSGTIIKHSFLNLNPSSTWKKIYVNVGMEISFEEADYQFQFFFGALKRNESDSSIVLLDNIKLMHFE
jgi:hypothetical protein